MKNYVICSDVHGCIKSMKKVVDFFLINKFDKLIILGDLLYHGPRNDIPKDYKNHINDNTIKTVDSFDNIYKIEEILKKYDYTNMGMQGVTDRYFFAKGSDDNRTHYLHIVDMKGNTYYNQILFRDYLNKYPEYVVKYC